jgi:hypothetical protein
MIQILRRFHAGCWLGLLLCLALIGSAPTASALPSFARQMGQACIACHISYPELTPYGRLFKLSGYTVGERQTLPLAVMGIASVTQVNNTQGNDIAYPRNGDAGLKAAACLLPARSPITSGCSRNGPTTI